MTVWFPKGGVPTTVSLQQGPCFHVAYMFCLRIPKHPGTEAKLRTSKGQSTVLSLIVVHGLVPFIVARRPVGSRTRFASNAPLVGRQYVPFVVPRSQAHRAPPCSSNVGKWQLSALADKLAVGSLECKSPALVMLSFCMWKTSPRCGRLNLFLHGLLNI